MKVLLVDDHALVRQSPAMLLSDFQCDMEIAEARSGDQAIELCNAEGTFDLVLLDKVTRHGNSGFD